MKPPLALFPLLLACTPLLGGAPVDGLGDPIPGGAVARLGTVRFRHGETPTALAWSPDGKRLITTAGSVVSLFDPEGRRAAVWELPAEEGWALEALAWSPDGKTVAVAGSVPVVVLLDPHSGARRTFATAEEGGEPAAALAWSPDGKQLVTLCGGKAQVRTPEGALVRELAPPQGALEVLAWSPDGKRLVAGGTETGLLLLDPLSGAIGPAARAPQKTAEEEDDEEQGPATVSALAFSPDGSILAAGDGDEVCLISAAGEELARLELSELGGLKALGFSPDGKTLACGGQARLALVDVAARREQGSLPRRVEALVFSPDGKTLLGAGWETALFSLDVGAGKVRPAPGHWGDVRALAWLPSGRALLSAGTDGQVLSWDPAAHTSTTLIHGPDAPTALAASPTGELCAVGDAEGIVLFAPDGAVRAQLEGPDLTPAALAFSPDGKLLAAACADGGVRLVVASATPTLTALSEAGSTAARAAAWSPDGKTVAATSWQGEGKEVGLWDVSGAQPARGRSLGGCTLDLRGLAFLPGGERLLVVAGNARLVQVATGETAVELKPGVFVDGGAVSPDGATIALWHQHRVTLWSAADGKLLRTLEGHLGEVEAAAFSPDGKLLATGSRDTTVLLWRLE